VPRHSAIGPSLRAMVRISAIVDGCGGGGGFAAAAAAAPLPPLTAHSSGTGQARHGGASQLMKPHLLQTSHRRAVVSVSSSCQRGTADTHNEQLRCDHLPVPLCTEACTPMGHV
jgi:hypothetical protein